MCSDPLPFEWLARDPKLCADTKFIDVDYEILMQTKREIVRSTPKMNDLLHPSNPDGRGQDSAILINTVEYAAIGCDLRNIPRLERLLRSVVDIEKCLVLCVAEVSITYMQTVSADALIAWTSTLSPDVTFALLEQQSPDQADNPFTETMMKHFAKLGTPLHSVFEYPGRHAQIQRFSEAGFTHVDYQNLWELWSDPRFLSPAQRIALDYIEPFDEWEEFALFASHYCLVLAHNREVPVPIGPRVKRQDSDVSVASDISARTSSPHRPFREWFAYQFSKDSGDMCQRHHGSSYAVPGQDAVAVHGGVGPRSRLATSAVCRPRHLKDEAPVVMPLEAGPRCCHTITTLNNDDNLLVGGRASPKQAFKDCWLQRGNCWQRVQDLPEPRYRHRVVAITLPDNSSGALLFGGKTDQCNVAADVLLWEPLLGWRTIRSGIGRDPVPRFGATLMRLGYNHGLLFGGMRQDGVIIQGLWRWRLITRNNTIVSIEFRASTALDATIGALPWFGRFGGSHSMLRDEVLIIGGIAKGGCIPTTYEILSIIGSFSNFAPEERELPLRITCVTPVRAPDCPRPFLVGHSTYRTRSGLSVILGGGATCFSFGNYYNTGLWVLYYRGSGLSTDWAVVPSRPSTMIDTKTAEKEGLANVQQHSTLIDQLTVHSASNIRDIVHSSQPNVLKRLDYGSCVNLWSASYLRSKISPERTVIVHDAPGRTMNFLCKDFSYQTMTFHKFLDMLSIPSSHLYLRSLAAQNASSTPANLATDWPEIASDFSLPTYLKSIEANIHSTVLRISNNINMWLHYDVMANVLFQVRGIKKLALFPPEDLPKLSFPAGASGSELNLFNNKSPGNEYDLHVPPDTKPVIAILKPGDALFIPPLWSHTGVSLPNDYTIPVKTHDSRTVKQQPRHNNTLESDRIPPAFPSLTFKEEDSSTPDNTSPVPHQNGIRQNNHTVVPSEPNTTTNHVEQEAEQENPFTNIAVNIFFRNLPSSKYAAGRDVYGNRDLMPYEEGRRDIDKIVRRFLISSSSAGVGPESTKKKRAKAAAAHEMAAQDGTDGAVMQDVDKSAGAVVLDDIPTDVTKAYLMRLSRELAERAEKL